jgi:hypothetical protein
MTDQVYQAARKVTMPPGEITKESASRAQSPPAAFPTSLREMDNLVEEVRPEYFIYGPDQGLLPLDVVKNHLLLADLSDDRLDLAVDLRASPWRGDFQRQSARKTRRCQRIRISGLRITIASKTERQESIQPDEDQPIDVSKHDPPTRPAARNDDLLAQDNVFGLNSRP